MILLFDVLQRFEIATRLDGTTLSSRLGRVAQAGKTASTDATKILQEFETGAIEGKFARNEVAKGLEYIRDKYSGTSVYTLIQSMIDHPEEFDFNGRGADGKGNGQEKMVDLADLEIMANTSGILKGLSKANNNVNAVMFSSSEKKDYGIFKAMDTVENSLEALAKNPNHEFGSKTDFTLGSPIDLGIFTNWCETQRKNNLAYRDHTNPQLKQRFVNADNLYRSALCLQEAVKEGVCTLMASNETLRGILDPNKEYTGLYSANTLAPDPTKKS